MMPFRAHRVAQRTSTGPHLTNKVIGSKILAKLPCHRWIRVQLPKQATIRGCAVSAARSAGNWLFAQDLIDAVAMR
jgi:hypothetical protein